MCYILELILLGRASFCEITHYYIFHRQFSPTLCYAVASASMPSLDSGRYNKQPA